MLEITPKFGAVQVIDFLPDVNIREIQERCEVSQKGKYPFIRAEYTMRDPCVSSAMIGRNLPLSEQLHEANAQICSEAADDEKVFLEEIGFRNGCRVLYYRLWRNKEVKK